MSHDLKINWLVFLLICKAITPIIVCLVAAHYLPNFYRDVTGYFHDIKLERQKRKKDNDDFFTTWVAEVRALPDPLIHHSMYRRDHERIRRDTTVGVG